MLGLSANRQLNLARRDLLRTHLNKPYQCLCNPSTPTTSDLFEDDLNKQVDNLTKANKIGHKVQGPSTKPRYHPYGSSSGHVVGDTGRITLGVVVAPIILQGQGKGLF